MKRNKASKGKQLRKIEPTGSCAWMWNLSYTQREDFHWELETWISNIKKTILSIKISSFFPLKIKDFSEAGIWEQAQKTPTQMRKFGKKKNSQDGFGVK